MYTTCLFCNHQLGANEVIEPFPVGRRLAFDQARGRLWVVCRRCEKWNLTPLEERWEAIEICERRFRDARKRVTSDNIGLAKLDEGLELVRIGKPLRPEFAAWRYGDQFGRRRQRQILTLAGLTVAGGGLIVVGLGAGVFGLASWAASQAVNELMAVAKRRRIIARVQDQEGGRLTVRGEHLPEVHFLSGGRFGGDWGLSVLHDDGTSILAGDAARRCAALLLPRINRSGASREKVQAAVGMIESAGEAARFLSAEAELSRYEAGALPELDLETRLAIEMAVNEENERVALEGELALLELEWKEAEEIAAIADELTLPEEVQRQLAELQHRAGRTLSP
jgi:hypothetical protein